MSTHEPSCRSTLSLEDGSLRVEHKIRTDVVYGHPVRKLGRHAVDTGCQVKRATARPVLVPSDQPVKILMETQAH